MRETVVQIKVHLRDYADAAACAVIDRNDRLDSVLEVLPRPDDSGIDRARGFSTGAAVKRSFERHFHERNHAIERGVQMQILHLRLEIRNAVLKRESPLQNIRVPFHLQLPRPGHVIEWNAACARAGWNGDTGQTREGQRFQVAHRLRQIAKAFAEKNPRRP